MHVALSRSMASHTRRRASGSIPVVGSSRKTIFGSPNDAIATESLRFIPPEYVPARASPASTSSTSSRALWTTALRSFHGISLKMVYSSRCSLPVSSGQMVSC